MKKMMLSVMLAGMALIFAGCTSLDAATKFNGLPVGKKGTTPPTAHLHVKMSGFYFFNCLPLATGSVGKVGRWAIFKDTVSVENAVSVLTREARTQYECTRVYDLQSETTNVTLPLLFSYKTVEVSATGTK